MSSLSNKVKIFHRLNKLKLKAGVPLDDTGHGYIDPKAIQKAQAAIDKQEDSYTQEVEAVIVCLDSTWEDIRAEKDDKRIKQLQNELYNYANNVLDIAGTFNYKLMKHFGKSLRDFCEKIDIKNKAHHVIVQAHIDVMWVAFQNNIRDDGGPQAEELKKIVAQAIEKHG